MSKAEFTQELIRALENDGIKTKETYINKSSGSGYNGLVRVGQTVAAVVNLDTFYEEHSSDDISVAVAHAKSVLAMRPEGCFINPEDIKDYEIVKDHIFPRLVPNRGSYEEKPGVPVADLKVVFAIRVFATDDGLGEAVVDCALLNLWGKSTQEVYEQAMANLAEDEYKIMDMMGVFYVLTNKYKTKGAVECLNPKAMEEIGNRFKKFFIIPSSVEEVIILADVGQTAEDLRQMVAMVNDEAVDEKDRLSNNVYRYNNGTLEVA